MPKNPNDGFSRPKGNKNFSPNSMKKASAKRLNKRAKSFSTKGSGAGY